jgi:putative hemolysin
VRIDQLRPVFRLIAFLIFLFITVMTMDALDALFPSLKGWRHLLLCVGVFIFLTFTILLFGIILPRALGKSQAGFFVARMTLPAARSIAMVMHPVAVIIEHVTAQFLKWFDLSLHALPAASEEEVIHIMDEGLHSGIFNASEKKMVQRVLDLDEQTVDALMTPRSQFVWLDLNDTEENNWRAIAKSGHSEFPVFKGTHDHFVGTVAVKSLWANISLIGSVKLSDVVTTPLYVPTTMTASQLIEEFRAKKRHTAFVVDEFGVVEGIVTVKDFFEAIVGILPEREVKQHYPKLIQKSPNSWIVDAVLDFKEAQEALHISLGESHEEEKRYQTVGGFFLHHLGHVPHEGESIVWKEFRFEVLKMNRHRIEQLLVVKEVDECFQK